MRHTLASTLMVVATTAGCGPGKDVVFDLPRLTVTGDPVTVREDAGNVSIPLRLSAPLDRPLSASYQIRGLEAQSDCQTPDFRAADGTVEWPAGVTEATVDLWVGDDGLAETDERLQITIGEVNGADVATTPTIVTIEDVDRAGIVHAETYGVQPGLPTDQSVQLQAALDAAGRLGRGVVALLPGDYQVGSVTLTPGTTLSARDVRWHRPPSSPAQTITLRATQPDSAADSPPTLVEGLVVDGDREEQGPFRNFELQDAHLIYLTGTSTNAGRLAATMEGVAMQSGTGSGLWIGDNADVTLCRCQASNVWRDAVTLHGSRSGAHIREFDATASEGTSGLVFESGGPGYQGETAIAVDLEDVLLSTGDLRIEAGGSSRIHAERVSMLMPPFALTAPEGSVLIEDSVLQIGIPGDTDNFWAIPHDVQVVHSTLIASNTVADKVVKAQPPPPGARSLFTASVRWGYGASDPPVAGTHTLTFDRCQFQAAPDVDMNDLVYAIDNPTSGGSVRVHASTLGPGVTDYFGPGCKDCLVEP